jgi:hypothetical protein
MADGGHAGGQITGFTSVGRVIDYLFGRNALIGLASAMLLLISGYATWSGMNDFIVGASSAGKSRDLGGGISVSHHHLVVAVTIALTFLMWIALREAIGKGRTALERLVTWPLYIFLVLWSVGFGYGFWWSLIAGEEATKIGLTSLQEEARDATSAVAARLDAVKVQVDSVASWSEGQMAREEASGGSCGVASGAGRGPLYNARRTVRDGVATLKDNIQKNWLVPVQADLDLLKKSTGGLEGANAEDRQRQFEAAAATIRGSSRNIAARSNELGKSTAAEMRALADSVSVSPGQPGFACHDPTLATRLRQAAEQASVPVSIRLREVAFNEGPAGVANAVKNLWANLGSYISSLLRFVFSGFSSTGSENAGTPITGRDMIALLATIGIDLGLFVLALLDPPAAAPIRRDAFTRQTQSLHLPPPTVVRQLASAFETAIARAPDASMEWVRQHFVHHSGHSYFVIPNLYSVKTEGDQERKEERRALALNQLAGVFEDLKLVTTVGVKDLDKLLEEEGRASKSDLSEVRKKWREKNRPDLASKKDDIMVRPVRNHGVLSKAERALDIAGWSAEAKHDIEVYRLVDVDGLTPLLSLLNDATLSKSADAAAAASAEIAEMSGRVATVAAKAPAKA